MSPVAASAPTQTETRSGAGPRHPGLDGLRGLAVAWVVAFHLWPDVIRGGWLGVGLFFTLSGYLIAGLLDSEVASTGRLRLGRFMSRRARRLLPAALVTIAATLALTAVLDDQPLRIIGIDSVTAALNVFNWHAAGDESGYAGIFDAAPEPLAHFWSLAIEEQFYLVFPAAVALTRRPGRVVAAMAAVGLAGVWLWWGSTDAYVATPVRALEIAAGAGLAVAAARYRRVQRLLQLPAGLSRRSTMAWAVGLSAAAALTVAAVIGLRPDHGLVFRGGPQLMSLCWVILVVAAVRDGRPARLMSWAPLRWLGLRSYAIYLFHWPLIELTDWHPVAVIAATLGLAEVSFHALEMPVRRGRGRLAVPALAVAAAAVVTVAAVAAAASMPTRGIAERAEGSDELPAWLSEQDSASVGAPVGDAAADPLAEVTAPDQAQASAPDPPATPVERSPEPADAVDDSASSESATSQSAASESSASASSSESSSSESSPTDAQSASPTPSPDAPEPSASSDTEPAPEATIADIDSGVADATDDTPVPATSDPVAVPERPETVPIVSVLGDSAALHIADGLREWGNASRLMAVVDHSRIGCSPAGTPDSQWSSLRGHINDGAHPMGFMEDRPCRDDYIEDGSDAVLVVDHGAVLFDHGNVDGEWESILDPALAAHVADSYRRLVDKARGVGATVVFTTAPVLLPSFGLDAADQPQTSPERAKAYNTLLSDLIEEFNTANGVGGVELIDTAVVLDASGYDGVYGRSDGMHVDYDRAEAFAAEVLGPALLGLLVGAG